MTPGKELLFCALGGSGEIGMNVNLYGCDGKWLMVDLGMTFSGNEYPGVDLVFADLDFIERERDNLIGVVLTHAHEDHIGAVPYFAEDLGVPLYANAAGIIPIVQALLAKGAALGTVLAFMMSVVALSLPEMILLRRVLKPPLLVTFVAVVGTGIVIVGYLFNALLAT